MSNTAKPKSISPAAALIHVQIRLAADGAIARRLAKLVRR